MSDATTIWFEGLSVPAFPHLTSDLTVDIAIVGGGMHGITAAYLATKAGAKVALLEKNTLGSGDTSCTTAFISYVIDEDIETLVDRFGKEQAKLIWESCQAAIRTIETIVQEEQLECEFRRTPLYQYAAKPEHALVLQNEVKVAQELGFNLTYHPDPVLAWPYGYSEACCNATFHPLKFLFGLAGSIQARAGQIFEQTPVEEITEADNQVYLKTARHTVIAKKVIVATHAPFNSPYLLQTKLKPDNTYVIAGSTPPGELPAGLHIDTVSPYHYLRVDPGTEADRVLLGGEDQATGKKTNTEERFAELFNYMKQLTDTFKPTHQWSGQIWSAVDGIPYIGHHPLHEHQLLGTGYAGDGMPFSVLSAMINVDLALGKENQYADLYRPSRLKNWLQFLKQNLKYPQEMVEHYLLKDWKASTDNIPAGSGSVIERDGKKIAVYKDEHGHLNAVSAVCTHMGCVVNWNEVEQTWDCPCHGSRFEPSGAVVSGPAQKPLPPAELS